MPQGFHRRDLQNFHSKSINKHVRKAPVVTTRSHASHLIVVRDQERWYRWECLGHQKANTQCCSAYERVRSARISYEQRSVETKCAFKVVVDDWNSKNMGYSELAWITRVNNRDVECIFSQSVNKIRVDHLENLSEMIGWKELVQWRPSRDRSISFFSSLV